MKNNNNQNVDREEEEFESISQWQMIWKDFLRHKAAMVALIILSIMYLIVATCGFLSPYDPNARFSDFTYSPPTDINILTEDGDLTWPYVYGQTTGRDPVTLAKTYKINKDEIHPIQFFVEGREYKLMGLFKTNIHLFGVDGREIFLMGTDNLGRDVFSRVMVGTRLSLTIGLVGVIISLILGILLGGISGFYGGAIDNIIQRIIEFLLSIPKLPFWMALAAALPDDWSIIQRYFAITIILSTMGWTGLARVVRGKLLSLREEDFVAAAEVAGASDIYIIMRHLIPNFMSYILVNITLALPAMIIGETALSFLGLGLRPPAISWGVLLQNAQKISTMAKYPWLLYPALFVILAILAFNFVGDGLRDAADPYSV